MSQSNLIPIPSPIPLTLQEVAAYESFYTRLSKAYKDLSTAQSNLNAIRQQLLGFHLGLLTVKELDPTKWKVSEDRKTLIPTNNKPQPTQPSVPSASPSAPSDVPQGDSDGFGTPI